mgnify:CR=1 FL=1
MAVVSIKHHKSLGRGVFAQQYLPIGSTVLIFGGDVITELPNPYIDDFHTQIGIDKFLGPSGGADDYVNHSCDPNTGLVQKTLTLIALRDIKAGEEITWDYSTYILDDPWTIPCLCESPMCRKNIADWSSLPEDCQQRYIGHGIVPDYIIAWCIKHS